MTPCFFASIPHAKGMHNVDKVVGSLQGCKTLGGNKTKLFSHLRFKIYDWTAIRTRIICSRYLFKNTRTQKPLKQQLKSMHIMYVLYAWKLHKAKLLNTLVLLYSPDTTHNCVSSLLINAAIWLTTSSSLLAEV